MPTNFKSQDWEDRKSTIEKLYVGKGYPLRVVKKKMKTPDFDPSQSQYRTRFKTWRFRKGEKDRRIKSKRQASSPASESFFSQDAEDVMRSSAGPQRSTSAFSIHGSSRWSPTAGQTDSAPVIEAPVDSDLDPADHFDTANFPAPYWKIHSGNYNPLANVGGPLSDSSPLILPLDEPSTYHSRLNNVSTNFQHSRSSLQLHKPGAVYSRADIPQRKQPSGISLGTPAVFEAPEQVPWMQGEDLHMEPSSAFSELEENPDAFSLDNFPSLWP